MKLFLKLVSNMIFGPIFETEIFQIYFWISGQNLREILLQKFWVFNEPKGMPEPPPFHSTNLWILNVFLKTFLNLSEILTQNQFPAFKNNFM